MRLNIRVAIQYDPKGRGLRLAIAYTRILRRGTRDCYDLYGFLAGYCGGGCYDDGYFHVEQRRRQGYLSYTHSYGFVWCDEKIGSSGLAGKEIGREIEAILEAIRDRRFGRWLCWTDDGIIDLRESAQRRLSCDRKQAFWMSPWF